MTKITIRDYVLEHIGNANFSIKRSGESISYEDLHDATDLTKEEIKKFDDFVWGPVSFEDMKKEDKNIFEPDNDYRWIRDQVKSLTRVKIPINKVAAWCQKGPTMTDDMLAEILAKAIDELLIEK